MDLLLKTGKALYAKINNKEKWVVFVLWFACSAFLLLCLCGVCVRLGKMLYLS